MEEVTVETLGQRPAENNCANRREAIRKIRQIGPCTFQDFDRCARIKARLMDN